MRALVAAFATADALVAGARTVRNEGFPLLDAMTPFQMDKLEELVGAAGSPRLRGPMALAGFGTAILFFAFETWTAVVAYRFNTGGRPLFSWPVFLLSPFEVGVLAAGLAGMAMFLVRCGLPRLNHPFFTVPGSDRATQDRFFLVVDPLDEGRVAGLRGLLFAQGAIMVSEAER